MSLVEVLVSALLGIVMSGTVLSLVAAGQKLARTLPESLDQQQRARVVLQVLGTELRDAGAGFEHEPLAGPLGRYFPPIAPSADGGVTIWKTTNANAQGTTAIGAAVGATLLALQDSALCPPGQAACGFVNGSSAIAFTPDGCRTPLRVAATAGSMLSLAAPLAGCALGPGAAIAQAAVHTYRVDPVALQLVRRDEVTGSSAPLVDGVTSLAAAFFADAGATTAISGRSDEELMRVRRVRLTLRLTASNPLRGVPDIDLVVDSAPRNLQGGGP